MDSSSNDWTPPDGDWAARLDGGGLSEPAPPVEGPAPAGPPWPVQAHPYPGGTPAEPQPYGPPGHYGQPYPGPYYQPGPPGWSGPYGQPGAGPYGAPLPYGYPAPYGGWPYPPYPPSPPRVVAAPAGSPYHRLARTRLHRWWRPLVGTLLLGTMAVVATIVLVIGALILYTVVQGDVPRRSGDAAILPTASADLALQLVLLGVLTPIVLITARLVQRRPMGSVTSVVGRLRWGWMLLCGGLAIGMTVVSTAMGYALAALTNEGPIEPPGWAGWGTFLVPAILIVALVPFQAAAEEYVFRGWLLQGIAACTLETRTGPVGRVFSVVFRTPWPAILISAAVFTSGHGYTGLAMLDIFVFGALAGWLAVKTGGLEATIAMHTVNNLVAFLLPAAAGQLAGSLKQGGAPWQMVVSDLVPMALYAAVVVALVRRRGVQTVTGEPAPAAP